MAWGWVNHQACRLVNHPQMGVFINHLKGYIFRLESLRLGGSAQLDGPSFSSLHLQGGLGLRQPNSCDGTIL
jgi:hypothetical protein